MTFQEWRDQYTLSTIQADHETIVHAAFDAGWKAGYKREWVGLTTDERANILRTYYADMYDAAEVIEELLKEKNKC